MSTTTLRAPESGFRYGTKQDIEILDCASCGLPFGIPAAFQGRRLKDGRDFYCPNGHANVYNGGESEEDRLKRRLKREAERAARLAAERDQARAEAIGQKAAKTRFKNQRDRDRLRVAAGVCPCCNRTFQDLARHMAGQHPGFVAQDHDDAGPGA